MFLTLNLLKVLKNLITLKKAYCDKESRIEVRHYYGDIGPIGPPTPTLVSTAQNVLRWTDPIVQSNLITPKLEIITELRTKYQSRLAMVYVLEPKCESLVTVVERKVSNFFFKNLPLHGCSLFFPPVYITPPLCHKLMIPKLDKNTFLTSNFIVYFWGRGSFNVLARFRVNFRKFRKTDRSVATGYEYGLEYEFAAPDGAHPCHQMDNFEPSRIRHAGKTIYRSNCKFLPIFVQCLNSFRLFEILDN